MKNSVFPIRQAANDEGMAVRINHLHKPVLTSLRELIDNIEKLKKLASTGKVLQFKRSKRNDD